MISPVFTSVGKTSLLQQYISRKFQKRYKATLGADFFVQEIMIGDVIVVLQVQILCFLVYTHLL
jgi:Ras-related protein Rab-7A